MRCALPNDCRQPTNQRRIPKAATAISIEHRSSLRNHQLRSSRLGVVMYAEQFDRDGYVHIKGALDPQELLAFRKFILSELTRKNVSLLTDSAIEYEPMRQFLMAP